MLSAKHGGAWIGKGGYIGGGTVIPNSGFGFSPLPEGGGKQRCNSPPTGRQIAAKAQSDAMPKAIGLDQRTKKQRQRDARMNLHAGP